MTTLENGSAQSSASPRYILGRHGHAFSTRARAEQIRAEIERLASVLAVHYIEDPRQPRPVVIGLSAQAQRVLLGSLTQRGVSEDTARQLVPH